MLGGRPRGIFFVMIVPRAKISPPQTPWGSPRSTAPARQARRTGQGWQCALASCRLAGRSENHSCEFSRWHGSGSFSALARVVSTIRELVMSWCRPATGAVGCGCRLPMCDGVWSCGPVSCERPLLPPDGDARSRARTLSRQCAGARHTKVDRPGGILAQAAGTEVPAAHAWRGYDVEIACQQRQWCDTGQ
jgi:hypothetical protein